jgi:hypothetical protein
MWLDPAVLFPVLFQPTDLIPGGDGDLHPKSGSGSRKGAEPSAGIIPTQSIPQGIRIKYSRRSPAVSAPLLGVGPESLPQEAQP